MQLKFRHNRVFQTGIVLLAVLAVAACLIPVLSPWSDTQMHAAMRNMGPSFSHPLGTDKFGRDLLVRICCGARISFLIGVVSALINGAAGIVYGGVAGYAGKNVDLILMRAADVIASIPSLLYVILILLVTGADEKGMILGLCISGWIETARIVRGEVLRLKEREFCVAARLLGAGRFHIFWRHILPNAAGPVIVNLTFLISQAVFTEAFLSFVGVGIPAPRASLGSLIQASRSQMQLYPYQLLFPTAALCLLILSLNLIGTGLEKRMRRRKEGE